MRRLGFKLLLLWALLLYPFVQADVFASASMRDSYSFAIQTQSQEQPDTPVSSASPVISITSTYPEPDDEDIPLDATIKIKFSIGILGYLLHNLSIEDEEGEELDDLEIYLEGGNSVNIDQPGLNPGTRYTVNIEDKFVWGSTDSSNSYSFSFTTISPSPAVKSVFPEDGAENVSISEEVTITFNQTVTAVNLEDIKIKDSSNEPVENVQASINSLSKVATGTVVEEEESEQTTISIAHDDFTPGETYTVYIPEGVVESNDIVNEEYDWSFSTVAPAPAPQTYLPVKNATNIPTDTEVSVVFDQDIVAGDLSKVYIYEWATETKLNGVSASLSGNKLVISHPGLKPDTKYFVTVEEGTVLSSDETQRNAFFNWPFTTAEAEEFEVTDVDPDKSSTGVPVDAQVTVSFSSNITALDLSGIHITEDESGEEVDDVSAAVSGNTLVIGHADFERGKEYTVGIPANSVKSESNINNSAFEWSFRTLLPSPAPETFQPARNGTKVPTDTEISVEFEQDIDEADLSDIRIRDEEENELEDVSADLSGNTISISHPELQNNTLYTVTIPGSTVLNSEETPNNSFSWSFRTIMSVPQVIGTIPENEATGIVTDSEISVTFDQNLEAIDLAGISIRNESDEEVEDVSAALEENTIQITHPAFAHGEIYTVHIPEEALQNSDEVSNEEYSWSFQTIFATPGVIATNPDDSETEVELDAEISITFDQDVTESDLSGISIFDDEENPVAGVTASLEEENTLLILHEEFIANTEYTVNIPAGSVQNTGNIQNEAYSWSFSTIAVAPEVVSTSPEDGDTGVDVDVPVNITFNQQVSAQEFSAIRITDSGENEVNIEAQLLNGNTIAIDHDTFDFNEEYTVVIPANTVLNEDELGNESYSWSFKTVLTPPEVVSTSPVSGAGRVDPGSTIRVNFNQDILEEDFSGIQISSNSGGTVSISSIQADDEVLIIRPVALESGTTYTIDIPSGTVKNEDGVANDTYSWSFTTVLATPEVSSFIPGANATAVPVDASVEITFNQNITAENLDQVNLREEGAGEVAGVSASMSGNTLVIDHPDLKNGRRYEVEIPENTVINEDQVGNEELSFSFRTIFTAPVVSSFNPADALSGVSVDEPVSVSFDQPVEAADLSLLSLTDTDGDELQGIEVAVNGSDLLVEHDDFENGTTYTVEIPAGTVENQDGLTNEPLTWTFTTILSAPAVASTIPFNNSKTVSVDSEVNVIFNQEVTEGDFTGLQILDDEGSAITGVAASLNGGVLQISHPGFLNNRDYEVIIPQDAVFNSDGIGNAEFNWAFKTVINISEVVAIEVNRSFGEASSSGDYRLVALPGTVNEPLAEVLPGSANAEWQAFWDNGADEDYLVRYDGSEIFTLAPGNGFWVTSTNALQYNQSVSSVALNEQNEFNIPLHEGWNIISNPLDINVEWATIEEINGMELQPLWGFESVFQSTGIFRSAKAGEAFYFLNDAGLDELVIPYFEASVSPKQSEEPEMIRISTLYGGKITSVSKLILTEEENSGSDIIAPPSGFEPASIRFLGDDTEYRSKRSEKRAGLYIRPVTNGREFELQLTSAGEKPLQVSVDGWSASFSEDIALIDTESGIAYELDNQEPVSLGTVKGNRKMLLIMGSTEFVEQEEAGYLPEEIELSPNYPNPFNPTTRINFSLPEESLVRLRVFDVLGREVSTLVNEVKRPGRYVVRFDGADLSSGIYFTVMETGNKRLVQKMLLMK